MSAYVSEFFLRLGRKLPFSSFQKVNTSSLNNYKSLQSISVPKYAISSSSNSLHTFYIPNLIPVNLILLDLNQLRPNSSHILHFSLHWFSLCHSLMSYFDFSVEFDPVLHDLLLRTLNDCRLLPGYIKR